MENSMEELFNSSFAFSCSKTAVTATSFSRWRRKHGDVSRRPSVRIWIIGVRIIENPLYKEILRKLPAQSVAWQQCLKKLWSCLLCFRLAINASFCSKLIRFTPNVSEMCSLGTLSIWTLSSPHSQCFILEMIVGGMFLKFIDTTSICMRQYLA